MLIDSTAERCWYCQAVLPKKAGTGDESDANWLNDLRGEDSGEDENAPPEDSSDEARRDEEVPDWLARIRQRKKEEHDQEDEIPKDTSLERTDEESPDWLKEIKNSFRSRPEEPEEAPAQGTPLASTTGETTAFLPEGTDDDTEEWLTKLAAWKPEPESGLVAETDATSAETDEKTEKVLPPEQEFISSGEEGSDLDRIRSFAVVNESVETSDEGELSSFSEAVLPELFEDNVEKLGTHVPDPPLSEHLEEDLSHLIETQKMEELNDVSTNEELDVPDLDLTPESMSLEPETSLADNDIPGEDDAVDDWLTGFKKLSPDEDIASQALPANGESRDALPFMGDDLPEWLAPVSPSTPDTAAPIIEENDNELPDEILEKAKLPAWLNAMRPVEAVAPPSQRREKPIGVAKRDGLLADIDGTLQSGESIEQRKVTQTYTPGLKISDRQKANVDLFNELLEGGTLELESEILQKKSSLSTILMRVGIALILLLAIFLPMFSPQALGVTPMLFPPEVVQTYGIIQNLPVDIPVLIAANFEAALAGEITLSSRSLLEHLMERNVPLTLLSTNANGAAIMQNEITRVSQVLGTFALQDSFINLGYLPGGNLGLQALAQNPGGALPFTSDLQPAWQHPVLQNVDNLSDFGAVILLTDNAEIARVWVEQVKPAMGSVPFLVVVSAQAAPMIQPYYDSGQINAYISGMNGSLAYEQIRQKPGSATLNFSSYQISLIMVALIVLCGGIYSLIRLPISSNKKANGS